MSMFKSCARFLAVDLSKSVVVGLLNASVSDKIQLNAAPLTARGIWAMLVSIISIITVAVQANGRIITSIGRFVSNPPISLWWSIIP